MYDMSLDADKFFTEDDLNTKGCDIDSSTWIASDRDVDYTPLYESKLVDIYNHRSSTFHGVERINMFGTKPKTTSPTVNQLISFEWHPKPRYWVNSSDARSRVPDWWHNQWLIGFRNALSSVADSRSLRVTIIPLVGSGNSMPLIYPKCSAIEVLCLVGNLNSLVIDYTVKQKVSGANLNFYIMRQLPVLSPNAYSSQDIEFVSSRVASLTFNSSMLNAGLIDELSIAPVSAGDNDLRATLAAELDAYYAHLYGLGRDDLRYILDSHEIMGPDYPSETFRVLKSNEIRQFGEYRTQRLVLEAWDRLFGDG